MDSIYVNREGVDITVKFSNSRAQYATWFILRKLSHHERLTVKENFLSELNLLYKREKSSAMIETKEKSLKLSSLSINFSTPQNIILPLSSSIFSNNKENLPVSTKNLANTVTNFRNTENNHEVSFFSKQKYKVVFDQKYSGIKKRNTPDEERKKYIINIANILNDCDNRTTVMIKNIPNHITQDNIIAMFNRNYSKTYNFFYLPIDFNKMANAGYAFINFKRNKYIIDFFLEFDNKPWTFPGCEDKLCYISYARIQGFKAICDHFHKSNIMKQVDQKLKPIIINN